MSSSRRATGAFSRGGQFNRRQPSRTKAGNGTVSREVAAASEPLEQRLCFAVSFAPGPADAIDEGSDATAVADFNRDGRDDLLTTDFSGSFRVQLGNADGTFAPAAPATAADTRGRGVVADFNGDGILDVAASDQSTLEVEGVEYALKVLLGVGDGTFTAGPTTAVGATGIGGIVVGDFNGDDKVDLAGSSYSKDTFSYSLALLLGVGNGTFTTAPSQLDDVDIDYLSVGDFNGDGRTDLTNTQYSFGRVTAFISGVGGTFNALPTFSTDDNNPSTYVGDFNRDGKDDLATATGSPFGGGGIVQLFLSDGDGTFTAAGKALENRESIGQLYVADFDGDGVPDLATDTSEAREPDDDRPDPTVFTPRILLSLGDGTFASPINLPATGTAGRPRVAGDFDGDGRVDLLTQDVGGAVRVLFNSDGPTPPPVLPTLSVADASIAEGNSGTKNLAFTVTRSGDLTRASTVSYRTQGQTATAGGDFTAILPTTLTFAPGQASRVVNVAIKGDTLQEGNEKFLVKLSGATGATLNDATATGTIRNDDTATPPPRMSVNDVKLFEGNSGTKGYTFTVRLDRASSRPTTVNYATSNGRGMAGSDYIAKSGSLTFAAGQTSKTVTVLVKGDRTREGNEVFFLNLFGARNATIADGQGRGSMLNDD